MFVEHCAAERVVDQCKDGGVGGTVVADDLMDTCGEPRCIADAVGGMTEVWRRRESCCVASAQLRVQVSSSRFCSCGSGGKGSPRPRSRVRRG